MRAGQETCRSNDRYPSCWGVWQGDERKIKTAIIGFSGWVITYR